MHTSTGTDIIDEFTETIVKSDAGIQYQYGKELTAPLLVEHFRLEDEKYNNIKKSLLGEGGAVTDPDDVKKIKGLKSKIGRRTLQAMGLPRGVLDPVVEDPFQFLVQTIIIETF